MHAISGNAAPPTAANPRLRALQSLRTAALASTCPITSPTPEAAALRDTPRSASPPPRSRSSPARSGSRFSSATSSPARCHDEEAVEHVAEIKLILLLFLIGLEISLPRLLQAGKAILTSGCLQFPICASRSSPPRSPALAMRFRRSSAGSPRPRR